MAVEKKAGVDLGKKPKSHPLGAATGSPKRSLHNNRHTASKKLQKAGVIKLKKTGAISVDWEKAVESQAFKTELDKVRSLYMRFKQI